MVWLIKKLFNTRKNLTRHIKKNSENILYVVTKFFLILKTFWHIKTLSKHTEKTLKHIKTICIKISIKKKICVCIEYRYKLINIRFAVKFL